MENRRKDYDTREFYSVAVLRGYMDKLRGKPYCNEHMPGSKLWEAYLIGYEELQ